jgi:hypothetical protein
MNKHLITFDELSIISIRTISPRTQILGLNNEHVVTDLTTAMIMFFNMGYDITALVDEYNKPEEEVI